MDWNEGNRIGMRGVEQKEATEMYRGDYHGHKET